MKTLPDTSALSAPIRALARQAATVESLSAPARQAALARVACPVDYMRYAEFEAVLRDLDLKPGMTVLDISSPQWFALLLASRHPDVSFQYVNILDRELDPYREIARVLGLNNLKYDRADARELSFPAGSFDRVVSISVIEHIYPAEEGDLSALREIARVLKPGGAFLLTVPCKDQGRIVYVDGTVYEREGQERKFFAREYDRASFALLVERGGFKTESAWLLGERPGLLAIDHYEWGPARGTLLARLSIAGRKVISRLFGLSLDEPLARRYLSISRQGEGRLVNISARLRKA